MTAEMPPGSVIITPTQMYAEIRVMSATLDHLASVIDPALTTIRQEVIDVRKDVGDHEARLRSIEKRLWFLAAGVLAAGGASQMLPLINAG